MPTVGLSVEQIEQLARAEPLSASGERSVVVLRQGDGGPHELVVAPPPDEAAEDAGTASPTHEDGDSSDDEVALELVPYGRGSAAIVTIRYVGDDLGERLAAIVADVKSERVPPVGLLLDLRGNGGGSTDGAAAALGVSCPVRPRSRSCIADT